MIGFWQSGSLRKRGGALRIATVLVAVAVSVLVFAGPSGAADTASQPFPFHTVLTRGVIKPNNVTQAAMDAKIRSFYGVWKTAYLRKAGGEYWVKYDATNRRIRHSS